MRDAILAVHEKYRSGTNASMTANNNALIHVDFSPFHVHLLVCGAGGELLAERV